MPEHAAETLDTQGPDETEAVEDWETSGPVNAIAKLQGQIEVAQRTNPTLAKKLKLALAELMKKSIPPKLQQKTPPKQLPKQQQQQRKKILEYGTKAKMDLIETPGYYYDQVQVVLDVQHNGNQCWVEVPKGTEVEFFVNGLKEPQLFMHGTEPKTLLQTNFQKPDKSSLFGDIFLIQAMGWSRSALSIKYPLAGGGNYAAVNGLLTGENLFFDDNARILPPEFFHDVTREELLSELVREASTLAFVWESTLTGGNQAPQEYQQGRASDIPVEDFRGVKPTTGGDPALRKFKNVEGYIWAHLRGTHPLAWGDFKAVLKTRRTISFPFLGIDLGTGVEQPEKVAINLELFLVGTTFKRPDDPSVIR